ncbi:MAG TPA: hemerythrin domain-containing protein [Rhodoferax sp.]|jgi:hemerythrin-like metal-binding protein|nr:hemerythrin domain-containing protein [Rhodoferax sp.]HOF50817.1 hemerythrin domain-containing protein [Rhodoferax sp.]HPW84930.1 hemerythrin domain-containing protein [Rhodoferax sp.]HQC86011.1 hemerythrin domain-containing protein [Rhodoferax sp.]HQY76739.1 hemerythrin domain-containing protein [Rhodoferax sp.]
MTTPQFSTTPVAWDDALLLDLKPMDDDHQEIVALLAEVVRADDDYLMPRWSALIAGMQRHFDEEDRWMQDTGFAADNCHSSQHKIILQILREGEARGHNGQHDVVRQMAYELGVWLPHHVEAMDSSLVIHLRSVGFDPVTRTVPNGYQATTESIHGCGGSTCGDTATATAGEVTPA